MKTMTSKTLGVVGVILACLIYSAALAEDLNQTQYVEMVRGLINNRNFTQADSMLREAISKYGSLNDLTILEADLAREKSDFPRAIKLYEAALTQTPNQPWLHTSLGTCFKSTGDLPAAYQQYLMALKLLPTDQNVINFFIKAIPENKTNEQVYKDIKELVSLNQMVMDSFVGFLSRKGENQFIITILTETGKISDAKYLSLGAHAYQQLGKVNEGYHLFFSSLNEGNADTNLVQSFFAYMKQNNLIDQAYKEYTQLLMNNPGNSFEKLMVGCLLIHQGKYAEGLKMIAETATDKKKRNSKMVEAFSFCLWYVPSTELIQGLSAQIDTSWPITILDPLANAYYNFKQYKEAEKIYREINRIYPMYAYFRYNLARVLEKTKNYNEAYANYNLAIQLGENADFRDYLEKRWLRLICTQGYQKQFWSDTQKQQRDHPWLPKQKLNLIRQCLVIGYDDEAVKIARELVRNPSVETDIKSQIINLLRQKGKNKAAKEILEDFLKTNPGAEFSISMADIYRDLAEYDKGIPLYLQAIVDQPNNIWLKTSLAACYEKINLPDKAWDQYKLALESAPPEIDFYNFLNNFIINHPKYTAEAIKIIASLLNQNNKNTTLKMFYGILQLKNHPSKETETLIDEAIKEVENSKNLYTILRFAEILQNVGEKKKALRVLEKAFVEEPNNDSVLLGLAKWHYNQGEYLKAENYLKPILDHDGNQEALNMVGSIYLRRNQKYYAEQTFAVNILINQNGNDDYNVLNNIYTNEGIRVGEFLKVGVWDEYRQEEPDLKSTLQAAKSFQVPKEKQSGLLGVLSINYLNAYTTWFWEDLPHFKLGYQRADFSSTISNDYWTSSPYVKHTFEISSDDLLKYHFEDAFNFQLGLGFKSSLVRGPENIRNVDTNQQESFLKLSADIWEIGKISGMISYIDSQILQSPVRNFSTNYYININHDFSLLDMGVNLGLYKYQQYSAPWPWTEYNTVWSGGIFKHIYGPHCAMVGLAYASNELNINTVHTYNSFLSYSTSLSPSIFFTLINNYALGSELNQYDNYSLSSEINYKYQITSPFILADEVISAKNDTNFKIGVKWVNYFNLDTRFIMFYGQIRLFI